MTEFSRLSFKTSRGLTYSIIFSAPTADVSLTLLFLHGFPSHSEEFHPQIVHFTRLGYGVIVPDLLGYGQTSSPDNAELYSFKHMSNDVMELIASLKLDTPIVGVGHDFGAILLSRMAAYHQDAFLATVFLTVGPPKMTSSANVRKINEVTKQKVGFELLGYVPWLGGDGTAAKTLETHAQSMMSLVYAEDGKIWDEWFRPLGKLEQFVKEDKKLPIGKWYTQDMQQAHLQIFGREGGYVGPLKWYEMWWEGRLALEEGGQDDVKLSKPALFVSDGDPMRVATLRQWAENLETKANCGRTLGALGES